MPAPLDIDQIWRDHSRRVLASLIRLFRDFDLAEEVLQDALLAAAQKWPIDGMPQNPAAWLVSAGRFRALDRLRRQRKDRDLGRQMADLGPMAIDPDPNGPDPNGPAMLPDDPLRLMFACCHPSLPPEQQVALTLRTLCGLTTEEIARAFLLRPSALAQRIVRAKQRIKEAGLRYELPEPADLPQRLGSVLRVIYLVFNEGYSAHSGDSLQRHDLTAEAIRLCRLLADFLPEAEVLGLLGLMMLHQARAMTRETGTGDLIPLDDQDRTAWDRALIAQGTDLVTRAFATGQVGPYSLQAAIAALHCAAPSPKDTDWHEILGLYTVMMRVAPSPVVQLNRAIAVSRVRGPAAALELILPLIRGGELAGYHLAHAACADMQRQLGDLSGAIAAYETALALCHQDPERRFLRRKLSDLQKPQG